MSPVTVYVKATTITHCKSVTEKDKYELTKTIITKKMLIKGYVMLCILYLKSTHENSLQKNSKYWLIDATLTPGDQVWSLAGVTTAVATTYSDDV